MVFVILMCLRLQGVVSTQNTIARNAQSHLTTARKEH